MKVAVIGGGSTYTPELVWGFLARIDEFPLDQLWLMDIDPSRLAIVGGYTRRICEKAGSPFDLHLTTDRIEAIRDADYVITQIRVGLMNARREDEYLGRRHGLIGQETTGVGGMAKALRTIPVLLEIATETHQHAKNAVLVNFTNPAGLVTQALSQYAPGVNCVGVCNVAINTKVKFINAIEERTGSIIDPATAFLDTLGLNHLTWHRGFKVKDKDYWHIVFEDYLEGIENDPHALFERKTVENLGMIPNYYLEYFYYTDKKLKQQLCWPPSRAEEVMLLEQELLSSYANPQSDELPDKLLERGGAYYSTMATQLLATHRNDTGEIHVVNIPNKNAVKEWPEDWVLELPARVDRSGFHPITTQSLPAVCFGLIAQVKAFEKLTIEAAVHGDRRAAYQALLAHPLGPQADRVEVVLDDILFTNREWLPRFL